MSVLIKGMNMPNVCGVCEIADAIKCDGWKHVRSVMLDRNKHCPLVEVPTPHGKWIKGVCNKCGFDWGKVAPIAGVPNYCPNCGVKMERREDG